MTGSSTHYLAPKLAARAKETAGEFGVFALAPLAAGELLVVWGGQVMSLAELETMPEIIQRHSIQVEEDLYLASVIPDEPADYVNHSCSPNAGLSGQIVLVAMRPIAPGEEITFDYAMSDGSPYDEFECDCGSPHCRGRVTGNDWRSPALWEKYAGYFSPYLQRRIAALRG